MARNGWECRIEHFVCIGWTELKKSTIGSVIAITYSSVVYAPEDCEALKYPGTESGYFQCCRCFLCRILSMDGIHL